MRNPRRLLDLALGYFVAAKHARHRARLRRGVGVIARWRVDPARWREFVALDAVRNGREPGSFNRLSLHQQVSAEGAEVIVGRTAVQVDGDFALLGGGVIRSVRLLAGPPPCIELALLYTVHDGSDARMSLRFPIASGADAAAARVLSHYESAISALRPQGA